MDWEAVSRYLAGESPVAERDSVQKWLASRPADSTVVIALDDALKGLTLGAEATAGIDVEGALARVNALRVKESDVLDITAVAKRRFSIAPAQVRWMKWAAAAALVIGIGALVWGGRTITNNDTPVIASRTFSTAVGGRDSLQLPDGSSVVLGPGSHLTLAAGYGQQARAVSLEGEAYFDVRHDASHPFSVTANGATIRDIGTSFGVHADSTGDVRVAVKSGTVQLSRSSATPTVLNAGDVGIAPQSGDVVAHRGAANDDDLAWTRGKLVFRNATISEVRDDLRRWYGVELLATDTMVLQRHFTATFDNRDSVGAVLRNISLSLPATIERHGDTAIVRPTQETRRRK